MRRVVLTTAGVLALALSAPAAALAHGHHGHHANVHHHLRHHSRTRVEIIGAQTTTSSPSSAPVSPAATVASFTNGVLTLTLADGSTLSGQVTSDTRILCRSSSSSTSSSDPDEQGDTQSQGNGEDQAGGDQSDQGDGGDQGQGDGGDQGSSEGVVTQCDTTALVTGASVGRAELRIGPNGAEFELVEVLS